MNPIMFAEMRAMGVHTLAAPPRACLFGQDQTGGK